MLRQSVSSSNLLSVGYDPTSQILEIEFHGGRIYQYFKVPATVYQNLMRAASHGQYFADFIRHSYSYQRVR